MSRLLVSSPTPSASAFTPTPTCPPVDLRPMAGCERRTKRRLPPTPPKEASLRQRPGGVSVGVCCRCNGSGKCQRYMCVVSGEPCTNCLPSRRGHCQNYGNAQGPVSSSLVPAPDKAMSVIDRPTTHQALLPPPTPRSESSPSENSLVSHNFASPALPSLSAIFWLNPPSSSMFQRAREMLVRGSWVTSSVISVPLRPMSACGVSSLCYLAASYQIQREGGGG